MKRYPFIACWLTGRGLLLSILLLPVVFASAQLCQGSLGDPIVNINFGNGTNPGPPVTAVQGLQYTATDCPNDGFYTVRTNSVRCWGSTWHSVANHTAADSGYFMLINASYQPSVFYLDTVQNLCSGTTYEFAAWLVNMQQPSAAAVCRVPIILPNVTFSIEKTDGTVLQSYTTGDIDATSFPVWRQFGFFFATPSGVSSVVLRIRNNAPGGCGNDIGLDDITFRPCGPQVVAGITGYAADSTRICQGTNQDFQLTASVSSSTSTPAYQWQRRNSNGTWADIAGATGTSYSAVVSSSTAAGAYAYRFGTADITNIGVPACRTYSKALSIIVTPLPVPGILASGLACTGKPFRLRASGGSTYTWTGPGNFTHTDSLLFFPDARSAQDGIYTVAAVSEAGCTATAFFTLTVLTGVQMATTFSDTTICQQTPVALSAQGSTNYRWTPAAGLSNPTIANPIATVADSMRYRVIATDANGCTDTAFVQLNIIKRAIANAGPDKSIIKSMGGTLEGSIRNRYTQFYWQPATGLSNNRVLQPQVLATGDAVYWLTAVSPNGCGTSTDTVRVKVYSDVYIPSAFTPNSDGKNDYWSIPVLQVFSQFELVVYDRYGRRVFQNKNLYQPWNGTANGEPLPTGAYVYYLTIPDLKKSWRGTVLIVR